MNNNKGYVTFDVPQTPSHFLMNSFRLKTVFRVVNQDGSNLKSTDIVAPINLIHHTMWKDVSLRLQDVLIEGNTQGYGEKVMET